MSFSNWEMYCAWHAYKHSNRLHIIQCHTTWLLSLWRENRVLFKSSQKWHTYLRKIQSQVFWLFDRWNVVQFCLNSSVSIRLYSSCTSNDWKHLYCSDISWTYSSLHLTARLDVNFHQTSLTVCLHCHVCVMCRLKHCWRPSVNISPWLHPIIHHQNIHWPLTSMLTHDGM